MINLPLSDELEWSEKNAKTISGQNASLKRPQPFYTCRVMLKIVACPISGGDRRRGDV